MKREDGIEKFSILIADDDPLAREVSATILKKHDYLVHTVQDGQQAVELLTRHTPDLIILDLAMPEMNGAHVCGWIRERNLTIPILVLTAFAAPTLRTLILEAGADDYLMKPFVPEA